MSKIVPILLDLTKDDDADVRLNCSKGLIELADEVGTDLLSETLVNSLSTMTKDCQWRVREAIFQLVGDLGLKFGKDVFNTKLQ